MINMAYEHYKIAPCVCIKINRLPDEQIDQFIILDALGKKSKISAAELKDRFVDSYWIQKNWVADKVYLRVLNLRKVGLIFKVITEIPNQFEYNQIMLRWIVDINFRMAECNSQKGNDLTDWPGDIVDFQGNRITEYKQRDAQDKFPMIPDEMLERYKVVRHAGTWSSYKDTHNISSGVDDSDVSIDGSGQSGGGNGSNAALAAAAYSAAGGGVFGTVAAALATMGSHDDDDDYSISGQSRIGNGDGSEYFDPGQEIQSSGSECNGGFGGGDCGGSVDL